jgi:PKD repeat protein
MGDGGETAGLCRALKDRSARLRSFPAVLLLPIVFSAAVFSAPTPLAPTTVWVADHKNLKQLDPATNQYSRTLGLAHEAEALAIDPKDGALWALANKHLLKFSSTGQALLDIDVKRLVSGFSDPKRFVLDPYDGSLWVAGEHGLARLSASGQKLLEAATSDGIEALALDADQGLWVLTKKELKRLSAQGGVTASLALRPHINDPKHLALDGLGALAWIGSEKELLQFDLASLGKAPLSIPLPGASGDPKPKIEALTIEPFAGTLWIASRAGSSDRLLSLDRSASYLTTTDLAPYALGDIEAMAFEPSTESLWLGGKKALGRFTANGSFVAKLPADKEIEAIGVGPFTLFPTLSLLDPTDSGTTNNPRPTIRLGLGALCSGRPCTLVDAYLRSFSLTADLNTTPIGALFGIANGEARYTPATRLPEGLNTLKATAKDLFGHASEPLSARFTVDTVAPQFLSITPADGATVSSAQVTIQGRVDDPTASVTLQNATGSALNLGGANFSFAVSLQPGLNSYTLTARDAAGNSTSVTLRVTLGSLSVTITSPAAGTSLAAAQVLVSGTILGPINTGVMVNGRVALTSGTQFFVLLPLDAGVNTLTATASSPEGATATHSITVTRTTTGPDPVEVTAEPLGGIVPLQVRFTVTRNNTQAIRRIEADFDGNGSVDFITTNSNAPITFTYTSSGVYQPRISVIQSQMTTSKSLIVMVADPQQMDQLFTALWTTMNNALGRGDVPTALGYLNANAKRKYQRVFQALLPQMPQIIASYSPLRRISISESIGEYAVNRTINGRNKIFLIYFLKDPDGVWRLDTM